MIGSEFTEVSKWMPRYAAVQNTDCILESFIFRVTIS